MKHNVALSTIDETPPSERNSSSIIREASAAQTPPDGRVAVPMVLSNAQASEIKDMLAEEYGVHGVQARALWADVLQIVAGISLDDQLAANEARHTVCL
ncbi:hypothetical protein [Rhodanobacter denitrificans]|uniref:hypothetical protein n=1 Tax=Rhodanobacter denitrificans TaxID=666685 RepID=UPI001F3EAB9B|nr:hypothetical protein [Rhodanobacter denitrificans]UJJ60616.1 hypothetical protein LRK55_19470 [Rhodanobacter denitrificans]